jgi:dihydrofolate reductase
MARVILYSSISLDGKVASDREHPGTAVPEDAELKAWKLHQVRGAGAHLMGRVTYQEMASYWPQSDDDYAEPMNSIPKVVFSRTLPDKEATWPETRVARGDLAAEIRDVKATYDSDVIAWGGAAFVAALAAADLIDEYRLLIQPIALGEGSALFDRLDEVRRFQLVDSTAYGSGITVQCYRPQRGEG